MKNALRFCFNPKVYDSVSYFQETVPGAAKSAEKASEKQPQADPKTEQNNLRKDIEKENSQQQRAELKESVQKKNTAREKLSPLMNQVANDMKEVKEVLGTYESLRSELDAKEMDLSFSADRYAVWDKTDSRWEGMSDEQLLTVYQTLQEMHGSLKVMKDTLKQAEKPSVEAHKILTGEKVKHLYLNSPYSGRKKFLKQVQEYNTTIGKYNGAWNGLSYLTDNYNHMVDRYNETVFERYRAQVIYFYDQYRILEHAKAMGGKSFEREDEKKVRPDMKKLESKYHEMEKQLSSLHSEENLQAALAEGVSYFNEQARMLNAKMRAQEGSDTLVRSSSEKNTSFPKTVEKEIEQIFERSENSPIRNECLEYIRGITGNFTKGGHTYYAYLFKIVQQNFGNLARTPLEDRKHDFLARLQSPEDFEKGPDQQINDGVKNLKNVPKVPEKKTGNLGN